MEKKLNMSSISENDLFDYGLHIFQNDDYFKFSIDSVLLAEFVDIHRNQKRVIDLCSGNAPILIILGHKFGDKIDIIGVELQKEVWSLGKKSLEINNIQNVEFLNLDIKDLPEIYKDSRFDIVTCNPPYFKKYDTSNLNDNHIKAIARHEICITLDDVISISSKMLKNGGYFYLVHRPERLSDIISLLKKYNFGLKRVQPVYDRDNTDCTLILIEAIYNGKDYVKISSPLFLKNYSSYKNIFGR